MKKCSCPCEASAPTGCGNPSPGLRHSNEIFGMFRYPSMIKAAGFCAAVFGFVAVVFKNSIVLIPEVTEVRLCNLLAVTFGIWFGPAGAWGCAVGNLVGDMGGSLTILSVAGFFGNFFSAWLPYKVWCVMGTLFGEGQTTRPGFTCKKWWLRYLVGGLLSVVSCTALLAIRFDIYGSMPAANTFAMIGLNNAGATIAGFGLFSLSCLVPSNLLPYWRKLMTEEEKLVFPSRTIRRLIVLIGLSVAICVFIVVYMLQNQLSLAVIDEFGQWLPMTVCLVYELAQVILGLSCRWTTKATDEAAVISLD